MPTRRHVLAHIATACVLAVGCEGAESPPGGVPITDVQLCMFRFGRTTAQEVIAVLGRPETSSSNAQTLILVYHHADRGRGFDEFLTFEFASYVLRDVSATTTGGMGARTIPSCLADASAFVGASEEVSP
jgi:hypothetical protein